MRLALLVLLTLSGARKEAQLRWPDGHWTLKVDQTKTVYVYELEIVISTQQVVPFYAGPQCFARAYAFHGKDWQAVFDASKGLKSDCSGAVNLK